MPDERAPIASPVPALGHPRVHLRETDSTNDRARALARSGAPHGTLVSAAFQTAGHGRHGRRWSAPPGACLLASLLLRSPPRLLPLIAAVAVCDVAGAQAQIKWPNDIVLARERARPGSDTAVGGGAAGGGAVGGDTAVGGDAAVQAGPRPLSDHGTALAKLAGILIEGDARHDWVVLGVGVNVAVAPQDLPAELATTAATLGQTPQDVEPAIERLLESLRRRLSEPAQATLDAWRAKDALRGRQIEWTASGGEAARQPGRDDGAQPHSGRADGIDGYGRLIVELDGGGRVELDAGEVHLLER